MNMRSLQSLLALCSLTILAGRVQADPFSFTTGAPDGRMGTASRPGLGGKMEIESADDFILSSETILTSGTFTGLLSGNTPVIGAVDIEIYRVFPQDSTNPPSGTVPTRVNSPSDVAFAQVGTLAGTMTVSTALLSGTFTVANSVLNGINRSLAPATGGEGPVTGQEVRFSFNPTTLLDLPAGHYFFIPQVQVTGGEFYWLSTARPGPIFTGDLQEWIRNSNLDPDWLRVGTDIVDGSAPPTFNAAFSLSGTTVGAVPEMGETMLLLGISLLVIGLSRSAWKSPA